MRGICPYCEGYFLSIGPTDKWKHNLERRLDAGNVGRHFKALSAPPEGSDERAG